MCPFSVADGHDLPRLIDQLVPGLTAQGDDVVVGFEDPVGEPVFAHELPNVFDRVQLGRPWRQCQKRNVCWDGELASGVPTGLIQDQQDVGAWRHLGRDLLEMPLHGLGVTAGQDEAGTDATGGTDGAEDICRLGALVLGRRGTGSAFRPASGELGLLIDPGFILEPDLYLGVVRKPGTDRRQLGGEVFLKSSTANSFCPLWRGRAEILRNPSARSSRPIKIFPKRNRSTHGKPPNQFASLSQNNRSLGTPKMSLIQCSTV